MRKDYTDGKKGKPLTPSLDQKIWNYEIKSQIADLGVSQQKAETIINALVALQSECSRTQDDLEAEIEVIKVELKRRIKKKQIEVEAKEAEAAASKCSFLTALFSLGIHCIIASN